MSLTSESFFCFFQVQPSISLTLSGDSTQCTNPNTQRPQPIQYDRGARPSRRYAGPGLFGRLLCLRLAIYRRHKPNRDVRTCYCAVERWSRRRCHPAEDGAASASRQRRLVGS